MPKISKEESDARRAEIIDACAALYEEESYHDITMTQVAANVSFGRANVYNYFPCKDEILLALMQREHERWTCDLVALRDACAGMDDERLACALAETLQGRTHMLKLLAMNLFDIEQNSSLEALTEFKGVYRRAIESLRAVLAAAKPLWDEARTDRFVFSFMPFLQGVYPYVFHSEKQLAAMAAAGVFQPDLTVYDVVRDCACKLLQEDEPRA